MPRPAEDVLPIATHALDLGSDAFRWDELYGRRIDLEDNRVVGAGCYISMATRLDATASELRMLRQRDNAGVPEVVQSGDVIGDITFQAYDSAAYRSAARIRAVVDGAPASGDMPGALVFATAADGGVTLTDRWEIDNAGHLLPGADGVASAGYEIGSSSLRVRRINLANLWVPYAYAMGRQAQSPTSSAQLHAVSGGNGGCVLIPFFLHGPMLLQSFSILCMNTASLRTAEFRLYADDRTPGSAGAIDFVTGTNGTLSFTPGAVGVRTANVSSPPVYLPPGTYWMALRNTSTGQVFDIGMETPHANWGTALTNYKITTAASVAALGSTIDPTAAAFSASANYIAARLNGRAFGQTAAF